MVSTSTVWTTGRVASESTRPAADPALLIRTGSPHCGAILLFEEPEISSMAPYCEQIPVPALVGPLSQHVVLRGAWCAVPVCAVLGCTMR